MYLEAEQYERKGTIMLQYACPDEGEGRYRFVLHTDTPSLLHQIADCFCITGAYTVFGDAHTQFTMAVTGHFAWELITALLDEQLLGDVWGKAIEDVVQQWQDDK